MTTRPTNNAEKKAARTYAARNGVKYTEALRTVRAEHQNSLHRDSTDHLASPSISESVLNRATSERGGRSLAEVRFYGALTAVLCVAAPFLLMTWAAGHFTTAAAEADRGWPTTLAVVWNRALAESAESLRLWLLLVSIPLAVALVIQSESQARRRRATAAC